MCQNRELIVSMIDYRLNRIVMHVRPEDKSHHNLEHIDDQELDSMQEKEDVQLMTIDHVRDLYVDEMMNRLVSIYRYEK